MIPTSPASWPRRSVTTSTTPSAPPTVPTPRSSRRRSCSPPAARRPASLMEREVAALCRLVDEPEQPFVAVVGGAKISTKIAPLEALIERVETPADRRRHGQHLAARPGPRGRPVAGRGGDARHRASGAATAPRSAGSSLELPQDVVVADDIESPIGSRSCAVDAVPADLMIVDIGPRPARAVPRRDRAAPGPCSGTARWACSRSREFAAGTMAVAACAGCQPTLSPWSAAASR